MNIAKCKLIQINIWLLIFLFLVSCIPSETANEQLNKGLKSHDWDAVLKALESGGSPSIKFRIGTTQSNEPVYYPAFLAAIDYGAPLELLEEFQKKGADFSLRTESGLNALHLAESNVEIIKWVIANVENPEDLLLERTKWGASVLHIASAGCDTSVINLYINLGIDINVRDIKGKTPLMYASASGCADVVEYLISEGADVYIKDNDGNSVLLLAARRGKIENLEVLLKTGIYVNAIDSSGKTVLMHVSQGGSDVIKILINAGAKINQLDINGRSALIWACTEYSGWPPPPQGFSRGTSTLTDSGKKHYSDSVMALIDNDADLDIQDNTGKKAFEYAKENENLKGTEAYWTLSDHSFEQ